MTGQLVDDLDTTVAFALAALGPSLDRDWDVPARGLTWTCRETLEHVADDFFAYACQIVAPTTGVSDYVPFVYASLRDEGPEVTIRSRPGAGNAGVLEVVETCAALLSTVVRSAPPDRRGWHPYGASDPGGFAAMGTVEALVHVHDVADALGFTWQPRADVVRRALERLFPHAPDDTDPWTTLLWATGRGELAGRERLSGWRWDGRPAQEKSGPFSRDRFSS